MSDWTGKLVSCKNRYEAACTRLGHVDEEIRKLAVTLSKNNLYSLEAVAELFGWKVEYIRKLRAEQGAPTRTYGQKEFVPFSDADLKRVEQLRAKKLKAVEQVNETRAAYVEYIRSVTAPSPTLAQVGEVLGLSRQRVSQMIS